MTPAGLYTAVLASLSAATFGVFMGPELSQPWLPLAMAAICILLAWLPFGPPLPAPLPAVPALMYDDLLTGVAASGVVGMIMEARAGEGSLFAQWTGLVVAVVAVDVAVRRGVFGKEKVV